MPSSLPRRRHRAQRFRYRRNTRHHDLRPPTRLPPAPPAPARRPVLLVRPGAKIAADGVVEEGESEVDEST
ncbi:hypothetical protein AB0B42_17400, partial [Streptomyces fradiae]|uniref:hypothetical protein n=1 Tax=Streptomyces fradiae TaxID=1906 RepID=UPI0033DE3CAC